MKNPNSLPSSRAITPARLFIIIVTLLVIASIVTATAYMQQDAPAPSAPQPASRVEKLIVTDSSRGGIERAGTTLAEGLAAAPQGPQAASNYTFTTATNASLTDMSSGTTQLVAADADDTASSVTNIGFDFYFQGVRYTQFSVNSNGLMRLGSTVVQGSTPYKPLAQASIPLITPYGADQRTLATTGKVHFKATGSAPNRVLVVEWLNMQSTFNAAGTSDLTYQARLYETTGVIEFVYGKATMSTAGAGDVNSKDPNIGFSSSNTAGTVGSVTAPQSGTPAPTFDGTSATAVANTYTAGTIPVLDSAANGSRRIFTFTPPTPTAPTNLTFTGVTSSAMTLNWTDSANETLYAIYRSTDGTNYTFQNTAAQNATSFAATGLNPSTTYFWQVYAVSEGAFSSALSGSQATNAPANISSTAVGGNWSATTTWVGGVVPTVSDNVTIADGATVTIDTAAGALTLNVGTGVVAPTTLIYEATTARTLTVASNVTIASNGTLSSAATGTQTAHTLSVGGNLTNNGVLDFSTNTNTAGAGITFTGAANNTFGGTGATTDIRTITINKGTSSSSILELNPTNFTVRGATTDSATANYLTLTNGTFKISGTFTGTYRTYVTSGTATYIPATAGLWLNNPNYTIAGQTGSPTVAGLLRITQGTHNVGTASGNSMDGSAGAVFIIEGGTLNTTGRFSPQSAVSYTQSAGTVNVCTTGQTSNSFGCFELFSSSSTFTMSGGTINLVQASTAATTPIDFDVLSTTVNYTGGTLNIGTAATATNFNFRINGNTPAIVINNTTNNKTATIRAQTVVYGDTTVSTGTTLNLNGFLFAELRNVTNNGTISGNTSGSRLYFAGSTAQTYSGTGTAGTVSLPLQSFDVDSTGGVTISPSTTNNIITNRVILFTGGVTNSNKLTLGIGGSSTGVVQIGNTTTATNAGSFDVQPTFNLGTGGEVISYLRTTNTRTTGNEVNPTRSLTSMTYDDNDATHALTIAGGDLTLSSPTTALTLTTGRVITGSNNLILSSGTATVTRTSGYVDGNLRKNYTATGSKTFEVGTANGYSPVTANVTAGTGNFTAKAVQTKQPNISGANALSRYWTLTATGLTADLTFTYLAGDVVGAEANYKIFKYNGSFTQFNPTTLNTTTHVATLNGVSSFSDWTLGEATAVQAGSLQLSAATYSVNENGTSLSIDVTRTGGTDGAVSVGYATSNGTATAGSDYTSQSGTLNWAAGDAANKTIVVPITDDSLYEGDETFTVTLSNPTGSATLGTPSSATVTITENDTAPTISIGNATVSEGGGNMVFTVTQSAASGVNTTFQYSTADGTATAGSDYTAATNASGSITAGNTNTTISIPVTDDSIYEVNETFTVTLSSPTNATIATGQGTATGTITENDAQPTLSIDNVTHNEGSTDTTSYTFTVTKTGATAVNATVDYATVDGTATAPSDYTALSTATLTFLPADTTKQVTVSANGDKLVEPNEAFTVHLSNAAGASITTADGTGTVTNDDHAPVALDKTETATAGQTALNYALEASDADGDGLTFSIVTGPQHGTLSSIRPSLCEANGCAAAVDYTPADGYTGPDSFTYKANDSANDSNTATVTITVSQANTPPTISDIADQTVSQNNSITVPFTVGDAETDPASLTLSGASSNQTRVPDANITFGGSGANRTVTVTPAANQTGTAIITITVTDGSSETASDEFTLTINAVTCTAMPSGMVAWYTGGNIFSNPADDIIGANNGTLQNGATSTASGKVGDALQFDGVDDYASASDTPALGFGTGDFSVDFWVKFNDLTDGGNGMVSKDNYGEAATYNGWLFNIYDGAGGVGFSTRNSADSAEVHARYATSNFQTGRWYHLAGVREANVLKFYVDGVLRATTAEPMPVNVSNSTQLRFGSLSAAAPQFFGGALDEVEVFNRALTATEVASLYNASTAGKCHTSTFQFSSATYTVGEGGGNATITVTRAGALDFPANVDVATSDGTATAGQDYTAVSYTEAGGQAFEFSAGKLSDTFQIPITQDSLTEGDETVNITLSNPVAFGTVGTITLGTPASSVLTITDDEGAPSLSVGDISINEGNTGMTDFTFTVSLSNPSGTPISVDYTTQDGTATVAGGDYQAKSGTLNFAAGDTSRQVTVSVNGDATLEANETFTLHLSNPSNATIGDADGVATITNDDAAPSFSIDDVTQNEGDSGTTSFTFTVTKTGSTALNASVDYETADGTATAPSDYTAITTSTLTFLPGDTTKQVTVQVNGDTVVEPDETFTVHLSNPSNATIGDADGTGTIKNDEHAPVASNVTETATAGTARTITLTATDADNDNLSFFIVDTPMHGTLSAISTPACASGTCTATVNYTASPASYSGPDSFTYKASDGVHDSNTATVNITVSSGNTNPTISDIADQTASQDNSVTAPFTVGDNEQTAASLSLSGSSSNQTLLPDANITFGGSGANRTITVTPAAGQTGAATVTVTVSDGAGGTASDSFVLTVNTIACYAPPAGMVSWWSAENNADDIYGTNNGTLQNGATYSAGKVGQAFSFDGVDDYVKTTDFMDLSSSGDEMTINAWVKRDTASGEARIVSKWHSIAGDPADESGWFFGFNSSGQLNWGTSVNGVYHQWLSTATFTDTTAFHHIALTVKAGVGSSLHVYVDGVEVPGSFVAGDGSQVPINTPWEVTIGALRCQTCGGGEILQVLNGKIDELEIFNRTLTASEIAGIYNASTAGLCHTSTLQFSQSAYSVSEAGGATSFASPQATITVTRTGAHDTAATVDYATSDGTATAGSDYTAINPAQTLNFAPGEVSKTFNVAIDDDSIDEADETVNLTLSNVTGTGASLGTPNTAVLTITDNDGTPSLSIDDVTHDEGDSGTTSYTFTVSLSNPSSSAVTVDYATANGTATAPSDYTALTTTQLTFMPGDTSKQVTVSVNGDTAFEPDEAFTVHLSNAANASISDADGTGTITNDDAAQRGSIQLSGMTYSGSEGSGQIAVTVTRTGGTDGAVSVTFNTSDGTATAGSDYTAVTNQTVSFDDGDAANKTVNIAINDDATYEGSESFNVTLTNATGGASLGSPASATVTISENDAEPTLAINDVTMSEGDAGTTSFTFTVTRTGQTAVNAAVNFATANGTATAGSDYVADNDSLAFLPGEMTKQITVTVNGDTLIEGNETFFVNLSSASGATIADGRGMGVINNDDSQPDNLSFTRFDFSGDGHADIAAWHGDTGDWHVIDSASGNESIQYDWGKTNLGDVIVPADYDGDGKCDFAVFRSSEGNWYIVNSSTSTNVIKHWGQTGDRPVPGDYDGDDKADVAVFRPADGNWYIHNSRDNSVTLRNWGATGDLAVPADYDGDRMTDIAVYRPSEGNWYIINSSTNTGTVQQWGVSTDKPVAADYDGDGKADMAVFRTADGNWYIRKSTGGVTLRNWGDSTDQPVPADYDGDGKADIAIWRPAEGTWYVIQSATDAGANYYLGVDGDMPVPGAYIP